MKSCLIRIIYFIIGFQHQIKIFCIFHTSSFKNWLVFRCEIRSTGLNIFEFKSENFVATNHQPEPISYALKDDDGLEFQNQPYEHVDDDVPVVDVVIKWRGPGRDYFTVAHHDSVVSAIAAMNKYNEPVVTRIMGRNNGTVSCPYY